MKSSWPAGITKVFFFTGAKMERLFREKLCQKAFLFKDSAIDCSKGNIGVNSFFLWILPALVIGWVTVDVLRKRGNYDHETDAQNDDIETVKKKPKYKHYKPDDLRIENVQAGGFYVLRSYGPKMEDLDVKVIARHDYEDRGGEWFELEGDSEIGRIWLTVVEDDLIQMKVVLQKISLAQLNVSRRKLAKIDHGEEGDVAFEGKRYLYEESGEGLFFRNGDRNHREEFYYWDFQSPQGTGSITVKRWGREDGRYDVTVYQPVSERQITVYAIGG